jgi:hypothetical protein
MKTHRIIASLLLGLAAVGGNVFAQATYSLVGEWRGIVHSDGVNLAFDITYYPNNTVVQSMAVPPNQNGTGSGIIYTRGTYHMIGPNFVEWNVTETKSCEGLTMNNCFPAPGLPVQRYSYRFEGPNRAINTVDGTVLNRVQ